MAAGSGGVSVEGGCIGKIGWGSPHVEVCVLLAVDRSLYPRANLQVLHGTHVEVPGNRDDFLGEALLQRGVGIDVDPAAEGLVRSCGSTCAKRNPTSRRTSEPSHNCGCCTATMVLPLC